MNSIINSVNLGSLTNIRTGKLDANASSADGRYPFFTCARKPLKIDNYSFDCECVLIAGNGDLNVKYYIGKFDAYQRTYIIETKPEKSEYLDLRYVYHFMETYVGKLREQSIGGIIKYIKLGNLTDAQIPLPSLAEQKRIAAILDAADALRAKRRQSLIELDTLIQSTFLDLFGDPVTNPKGWKTDRFENALEEIESGWSPKCLDHPAETNEWGILKLGAVTYCTYNDKTHKGLPSHEEPRRKIEVKKGDLLFARKNTHDLVAASAYVWETRPKLMLPDLIFRLQLKSQNVYNKIFLWQLLVNKHQKKTIQKLAGGAAGSMPNISKAKLKSVELVIPPLLLQQQFTTIVEKIEAQKARYQAQLDELDTLFASLQSRAFKGEL